MEKYLSPIFNVFQTALTSEINIFGTFLKKSILGLLWFVHNLQYWLTLIRSGLKSQAPKSLSASPRQISDVGPNEDPLDLFKQGISLLLYLSCLAVFKFCFRLTQLTYLAALSVYIHLGFKDPVPLIIINDPDE